MNGRGCWFHFSNTAYIPMGWGGHCQNILVTNGDRGVLLSGFWSGYVFMILFTQVMAFMGIVTDVPEP